MCLDMRYCVYRMDLKVFRITVKPVSDILDCWMDNATTDKIE